jgi:Bacteriophage holin family
MKTKLVLFVFALFSVLAPVKPMVLIAVLTIILDMCFGIWRSVRKNGWASIRSRRLSNTISKSLLYSGAIVFIFLLEKFVIADILAYFISVDLVLTKAFTFFCVFTEVKSINENYFSVTGINVWDRFISFIKRGKEQLEDLK